MNGKRVLVIGLGVSGRSAAKQLLHKQAIVWGYDENLDSIKQHKEISLLCSEGLQLGDQEKVDQVVLSPGISPLHPIVQRAKSQGIEVIGEAELAFRTLQCPILGITGTNGKSTVTLMVEHVLKKEGISTIAAGNVGKPLTSLTTLTSNSVLVAELSSFQLETMTSKVLDAAAILNITPDHLDRYASFDEYVMAKLRIIECLKPGRRVIIHEDIYHAYPQKFKNCNYSILSNNFTQLDSQNKKAAFLLAKEMGLTKEEFDRNIESFVKPEHRLEFIRTVNGVNYHNDSKGTNIHSVIAAVTSFKLPVILIAGGVDKGSSYSEWIEPFAKHVKHLCLIGEAANKIQSELSHYYPVSLYSSLEEAVIGATKLAKAGEHVLLSPGCASFDMFNNFEHRGNRFKEIVHEI